MKHYVQTVKNSPHHMKTPCPFINKGRTESDAILSGVKIGSSWCQFDCEYHKNNNMIENGDKSIIWVECEKLDIL